MPKAKLSIVIPALNEADKIAELVGGILPAARIFLEDFEIILVDDCSIDGTGSIMDDFASRDPKVRVIHNSQPFGDNFALKMALAYANFGSITLIPGDGTFQTESVARMFRAAGAADLVITYRENLSAVSVPRAILSYLTRFILNFTLGVSIADYQSMIVYPVQRLREAPIETIDCYQARALICLLRLKLIYLQVPVSVSAAKGPSRKVTLYNDLAFAKMLLSLRRKSPINIQRSGILDILSKKTRRGGDSS